MDVPRNPQLPNLPSVDSLFEKPIEPEASKTEGDAKVSQLGKDFILIDQPAATSIQNTVKEGGTEKIGDLKTKYKSLVKKNPDLRAIGNKALDLMGPMMKMSPSFEAKFYKNMLVILKDPYLAKTFSEFLDVNFASRSKLFEVISKPNQKFVPEIYSTSLEATVGMKIISSQIENDELFNFVESINDFCLGINTQPFTDYIQNPVTQKGEDGNLRRRVGQIDLDAIAKDEGISPLNSLNYYSRNDLEYCTHDISKIVHTNEVGVPDKVKFTVGRAILDASNIDINMVETNIDVDISSFLTKGLNKEESLNEAKELFGVFKRLASNLPTDRDGIWEKVLSKLNFLNDEQKVELKEHFSQLLGKDGEWGEMDRKLAALIFVSSPENRSDLVEKGLIRDRSESLRLLGGWSQELGPEIYSLLVRLDEKPEIKDVKRLQGQIDTFLSDPKIEKEKLTDFLTSYLEKKEDVIQKRDELMKYIGEHGDGSKYNGIRRFALELYPS